VSATFKFGINEKVNEFKRSAYTDNSAAKA
jgi:hypothetical protein